MKCPKCGTELKDGHLYCEKCGEEIHIVPDYEPEIEYSMHETLSGIVEDVLEEVPDSTKEEKQQSKKRHGRFVIAACIAAAAVFVTVVSVVVVRTHRHNSVNYQIMRANACVAAGDSQKAIDYCLRAIELDESNVPLRFMLADIYEQLGMEEENINCLYAIIKMSYASESEEEAAYNKMINAYKRLEDYASINTLLLNTENENIRAAYQSYMAAAPEFSYKEGTYAEVIPLKLTSSTQGTIYYTTDGTIPNENSTVYTTPIFLETGSYTITTMFVNQYGIESEVVAKTYHIDVLKPPAPEVETYSGEYTIPTMIKVQVPMDCTVYYTTDGSIPTNQSNIYRGKFPMPLGKSTFKFIAYSNEGVFGDCTTRQYELTLNTEFTVEMAVNGLIEYMIAAGKIWDAAGTTTGDLNGRYLYEFQYALSIPMQGDYYIISEVYEDSSGVVNKTGTTYAANVYAPEYYKLSVGESDEYILEALQ